MFKLSMIPRAIWAAILVAWARGRGYRMLANPDEENNRWVHCLTCPHRIPGPEIIGDQCGKCGCLLVAKVLLTTERCPIKKWNRIWTKGP